VVGTGFCSSDKMELISWNLFSAGFADQASTMYKNVLGADVSGVLVSYLFIWITVITRGASHPP